MRRILGLLTLLPALAFAQVGLEVSNNTYGADRLKSDVGFAATFGSKFYGFAGYEKPKIQLVGQNLGSVELIGGGIGLRHRQDRFSFFGEFGYYHPKFSSSMDIILKEAVTTTLRNTHGKPNGVNHWEHTIYDLDAGYGGRIGVSYQVRKHLYGVASYRFLRLNESLDACTGEDAKCKFPVDGRHHQERNTLSFDAFMLGVRLEF